MPVKSEISHFKTFPHLKRRAGGEWYEHSTVTSGCTNDLFVSTDNPGWRKKVSKNQKVGGTFHVIKRDYEEQSTLGIEPILFENAARTYGDITVPRAFQGSFGNSTITPWPTIAAPNWNRLASFGRKAIAATAPTSSEFDAFTSVGELLREGIPKAIGLGMTGKERARVARNAGSEYLNYQFGWKPLISDVKNLVRVASEAEKLWKQYERDSGRLVKRRYSFPTESTSSTRVETRNFANLLESRCMVGSSASGKLTRTETTTTRRWFSGCYRYYIPEDPFARSMSRAQKLYGVIPDPDSLWNLAPWTWAIDWFSDAGTLMENLSAFGTDRLVMPYGYIMEETTSTKEFVWQGDRFLSYRGNHTLVQRFTVTQKLRLSASPYGFYVGAIDLSPQQLAILTALGLSKT